MNTWYEIVPADTLFFRGTEPLEAGQPATKPLFPPPVSVLEGAIRTAVLMQNTVSFKDYRDNRCPDQILERIGRCGQRPPFSVTAMAFTVDGEPYVAAPASWYVDLSILNGLKPLFGKDFEGLSVARFEARETERNNLEICSSSGERLPLLPMTDPFSMSGFWIRSEKLLKFTAEPFQEKDVLAPGDLYDVEPRTGIAMDNGRRVLRRQLYSACHVRLRHGISLLIGLDKDPGLESSGMLQLGGERRICAYHTTRGPKLPEGPGCFFMNLSPLILTQEILGQICCAPAPMTTAGWDLSTGFHKPTTTWLPAGSVFYQKINSHCIPLA
jgi:CRISPR-associated protein Cmr3